jgi:hypothetical protein
MRSGFNILKRDVGANRQLTRAIAKMKEASIERIAIAYPRGGFGARAPQR